jgi:hypothetical protein
MNKSNTISYSTKEIKNTLRVNSAQYLGDYKVIILFNDGKKTEVNFADFLNKKDLGYLSKYRKTSNFKKFKIENGNIVWGKDWDLIFPIDQLYNGHIE